MKRVHLLVSLFSLVVSVKAQSSWFVDSAATPPGDGSPSAPYSSIQYAINQSATVSGDTLLVAPGTYLESLRFLGKSIVVRGVGGATTTVLQSGTNPHAAIRWIDGEGAGTRLEGFTVQGAVNNSSAGGGMLCIGAIGQVRDCVFASCRAYQGPGGGARLEGGSSMDFERVEFRSCVSFYSGGGIDLSNSHAQVVDCLLQNCGSGGGWAGGLGGAIHGSSASLEIHGSNFTGNYSDGTGGGLSLALSTAQISRSRFTGNQCDGVGGGIRLFDSTASIADCWLKGNSGYAGSYLGHALHSNRPTTTYVRSTVFLQHGWTSVPVSTAAVVGATLERCTLARNVTYWIADSAAARDCVLTNCVVWGNVPSANSLTACSVRYSNVEGGASGLGNIDVDPQFVDLFGDDLRLLPGSPCIDSGDPTSFPDPDGTRADMGAFPWIAEIEAYCTGKLNSAGCVPTVAWLGRPSYTTDDFHVVAVNAINNKTGLCFWGFAPRSDPFLGGTLCVAPPTVRTPLQGSGGSLQGNDCTGAWAFSFDAAYLQSAALAPDTVVYAQFWGRDPGFAPPNNAMLSNAVRFRVEH